MSEEARRPAPLGDVDELVQLRWQLGQVREYVAALAERGSPAYGSEAYQLPAAIILGIIDRPQQAMDLQADVARSIGRTFRPGDADE
ncbi:hypothetical protein ACFOYW_17075 [Gryllotalpicola reticulitermitis]|uniref:Uncharacterized protein n=1 Tax=Gryllotalpicola reticulitermitis TaxID=1184153 RepID=A0ABV8QBN2_9MICO